MRLHTDKDNPQSDVKGRLAIIVCASGKSTRFKANKLLHPLPNGKTLLQTTLAHIRQSASLSQRATSCTVVIPPHPPELIEQVVQSGCTASVMEPLSTGLGETIAYAVAHTGSATGWLVCLADMPAINPATYQRLIEHAGEKILTPEYLGRRGHPVYFPNRFYSDLVSLQGDKGAASVLNRHREALQQLPVPDPAIVMDVDTQADLQLILSQMALPPDAGY